MRCLKIAVTLVVLLAIFANVHCVARCAVTPCDQSSSDVPPCHRHSSPGSKHCATPLFAAGARFQPAYHPVAQPVTADTAAPPQWRPFVRHNAATLPVDSSAPSLLILRI